MPSRTEYYIGLMSGTSLDGVDAVLVDFSGGRVRTVGTAYVAYPEATRIEALALNSPTNDELHRGARLAIQLAEIYGEAVTVLLRSAAVSPSSICAIGCHGQTVRHNPRAGYSVQLNAPAQLAELAGIDVICDFRSRDIAAGGQGAPLVPAAHHALFGHTSEHRVVLNLGGIANLTNLNPGHPIIGFDCGPANMLLDGWVSHCLNQPFDRDGQWAGSGRPLPKLEQALLAHPFFALQPPKSCGREQFSLPVLQSHLSGKERPEDVQATLLRVTALSCADGIQRWCAGADSLYVCGGGAYNAALMTALAEALDPISVQTTGDLGVEPHLVEAIAFAWLARQHVHRASGNLPSVTGAGGPRILGACYPA